jgi:hypothetical protein
MKITRSAHLSSKFVATWETGECGGKPANFSRNPIMGFLAWNLLYRFGNDEPPSFQASASCKRQDVVAVCPVLEGVDGVGFVERPRFLVPGILLYYNFLKWQLLVRSKSTFYIAALTQ